MHNKRSILVVTVLLFSGASNASSSLSDLWEKMNASVSQLDYEGRFVYQTGDQLDSMYLVHRINDGVELERLISLNGQPREVIRGGNSVAFIQLGKANIHVAGDEVGRAINQASFSKSALINSHYSLSLGGEYRVAGRATQLLKITPKDNLRFGYHLYLDKNTALPLRSVMFDDEGEQRSQLLFTDLKVTHEITPIEQDLSALEALQSCPKHHPNLNVAPASWKFNNLPNGFSMHSYRNIEEEKREHFVFTDGLAKVSIYIDMPDENSLQGASRMGAVEALGVQRLNYQITVVGEVPQRTLRHFSLALMSVKDASNN